MSLDTRTTTRLLEGLADPTADAVWREFDRRYRPILLGFGRHLGLAPDDAADVAQETLLQFVQAYRAGRYDRDRGRLRSWIIGIAKHRAFDTMRARGRQSRQGDEMMDEMPDDRTLSDLWLAQRRAAILRQGLDDLRRTSKLDEKTIRAFEMLAQTNAAAAEVAAALDMTVADVYQAKNRVASRIRKMVERLETLYDDEEGG